MKQRMPRRQSSAATISDVAREAGVSPMTVSRVINNETNVREATRERVTAAVARLHYSPNPAARSLAGAQPIRLGLLYSNPSAAYLSEFLVGSLDSASQANIQLIVEKCELGDHEIEVAQMLIAGGIDGLILPSPLCDSSDLLRMLTREDVPSVAVGSGSPSADLLAVSIDEVTAAHTMMRHILALGHRRIGFVIGNPKQSVSAKRLEGYRLALAEAGIAYDDRLVAQGLFTYRSGLEAADVLLDIADPPTAIFASNDDMAAAVVAAAHRRGLDVPRDLTVCGFDDTTLATATWPELTTIHQPIADMARAGVELLVKEVRSRRNGNVNASEHIQLDFRLVRRETDAVPAQARAHP